MDFTFARTPHLVSGTGSIKKLPDIIRSFGKSVLIVTGKHSFVNSKAWTDLQERLTQKNIEFFHQTVENEPTCEIVDNMVKGFGDRDLQCVVGIGGGSALDAAKAAAAMLPLREPVVDYLEGIGDRKHPGNSLPFIAIPTTAGTGSEATKNAVISRVGPGGFKRSLRHDDFIARYAILDADLAVRAPREVTAACGMDALTQLIESFVSTKANPLTDALALSGLAHIKDNLLYACTPDGEDDPDVRGELAYAAYLSGVTLANAGLGVVHGIASSIGARYPLAHGLVCGSLLRPACAVTIERLKETEGKRGPYLRKYARVGRILSGRLGNSVAEGCELLIKTLGEMNGELGIPDIRSAGVPDGALGNIVSDTGCKNNPGPLGPEDLVDILEWEPEEEEDDNGNSEPSSAILLR